MILVVFTGWLLYLKSCRLFEMNFFDVFGFVSYEDDQISGTGKGYWGKGSIVGRKIDL